VSPGRRCSGNRARGSAGGDGHRRNSLLGICGIDGMVVVEELERIGW
jgi:hypothetical protein